MLGSLLAKWKETFLRTFDIRVGEFRRVWLMQLNVFLLIQCLWIIKPVANAQFLSRVGIERLPLVFLLVALTALGVSTVYSGILNRKALGSVMGSTYLLSIFSLFTFAVLMRLDLFPNWMSYVFYIGVALFGLITTSQFWLMGNLVFNSLEAKRLFGFIGAGAIAGGISGGYMTSLLAPLLDSENMLFVAAGLLLISMKVNHSIWHTYVPEVQRKTQPGAAVPPQEFPFRLLMHSKHLTYLALIMGISVVVAKLVEYQFSAIASARIEDPDRLTAFFGFWFSTSNVVSLGIQLLITRRVVGFLGVGRSLFVLPGALFAGASAVLYAPILWTGTALKLFDISLKQSINKAATELLILPIPQRIKSQVKTVIDVFVDTTATGIGGILLIFLINGFDLSVRAVAIMIMCLIGVWLYFAVRARREYALSFQDKLGIPRSVHKKRPLQLSDTSVAEGIRRTLQTGTEPQILFLLARIEESRHIPLMQDVIPLLQHESSKVRQGALRCLYYHTDRRLSERIHPLLRDPDAEVRSRAFSCLLKHSRKDGVPFIERHLDDPDPAISGAALVGLATEARDNQVMQRLFQLERRILAWDQEAGVQTDGEEEYAKKWVVLRAVGYGRIVSCYPLLTTYMHDAKEEVVQQAILAAGSTEDLYFVKSLIGFLPDKNTRGTARKALAKYEPSVLLPLLSRISREKDLSHDILIQLPGVAEMMDAPQAIAFLIELEQRQEQKVKQEVLKTLQSLKQKYPHLKISGRHILGMLKEEVDLYKATLGQIKAAEQYWSAPDAEPVHAAGEDLVHLLRQRLDRILDRMFRIIALNYPAQVTLPPLRDIRHQEPQVRVNTIELLDNILDPGLRKMVMPILETIMLDNPTAETLNRLGMVLPSETESLSALLTGVNEQLKIAALQVIASHPSPSLFHALIEQASEDPHPKVRQMTVGLMEADRKGES